MDHDFFLEQAERLMRAYGDGNYPDECLKALYSELKHISNVRFEKTITRLLATYVNPRNPPGVDKIEKIMTDIREENAEKLKLVNTEKAKEAMKVVESVSEEDVSRFFSSLKLGIKH